MFKKCLLACLLLVVLIVAGFAALVFLVPTERIKTEILQAIETSTGQKVTIEGPLEWKLFPSLRLKASQLTLFNPKEFNKDAFVTIDEAEIVLALAPLLRKQIDIKTFILHSPEINLAVNSKGATNWESFIRSKPATNTPLPPPNTESTEATSFLNSVGQIQIKAGRINYTNEQDNKKIQITPIELSFKPKGAAYALEATLRATMQGIPYHFSVKSTLLQGANNTLEYANFVIEGTAQAVQWSFQSDKGGLDLKSTTLNIPSFTIKLNEDSIKGNASIGLIPLKIKIVTVGKTLNLDHLMTQTSSGVTPGKRSNKTQEPSLRSYQSSLKEGALDIRLSWDEIIKSGLHFENVAITAGAFDGAVMVKTNAEYQGGLFKSEHMVSLASDALLVHHRGQFKQIPVQALLQQLIGVRSVQGQGLLSFDITTRGISTLIPSATGKITIDVTQGSLSGIDLGYYFAQARALQRKQAFEERERKNSTLLFSSLSTRITVKGPVLYHDSIEMRSKDYTVDGTGQLNLSNDAISYQLKAMDVNKPDGPPLAIRVTGTLAHPNIAPDVEAYLSYFLERELKKHLLKALGPNTDAEGAATPEAVNPEKVLKQLFNF